MPALSGIPKTNVTHLEQTHPRGIIPNTIVNSRVLGQLICTSKMRKKLDKSLDIDRVKRASYISKIKLVQSGKREYRDVKETFDRIYREKRGSTEVESASGLARSRIKTKRLTTTTWGQMSVSVRAEVEEVTAFLIHYDSRAFYKKSVDLKRSIETTDGDGFNGQGFFEANLEHRQSLDSNHHGHHRDRVLRA